MMKILRNVSHSIIHKSKRGNACILSFFAYSLLRVSFDERTMKFSSNRQVDSAKNLELKNSFPIHISNLDMKPPKSSQAYKSHGAAGFYRKKGSNDSVSSDASVVTLKASNKVSIFLTDNISCKTFHGSLS
jgi:hypothetical protein